MSVVIPPKILRSDVATAMRSQMQSAVDKKGKIERDDVVALFDRVYDKKTEQVDSNAAAALAAISDEFKDKMDTGAQALATEFIQAYHSDAMGGLTDEYRKQVEQQLAQDKHDFREFLTEDHKEHKKLSHEEFREELQDNRVETSDWQSLMLWLKTGVKTNPYTN